MNKTVQLSVRKKLLLTAMMMAMSGTVMAVTSAPTGTVKGHIPVYASAGVTFSDVNGNGVADIGDTITAAGAGFSDPDMDDEVPASFIWSRDGVVVPGVTGATYTLALADLGKKITVEVVPTTDSAITDPFEGMAVAATTGGAIDGGTGGDGTVTVTPATTPLSAVIVDTGGTEVTGNPLVGDVVSAKTTCADGSIDCSGLTYKWQIETTAGSNSFSDIPGATSKDYTVLKGDQKRKLQVIVN
ncbi:invasin family protein [Salmonella enterica]|nr:invasin family protein [Salmonella enterica]